MLKKIIPLWFIATIIASCGSYSPRHYGNTGYSYYNFSKPGYYDIYTKRYVYNNAFTTEVRLNEALERKAKLGEDADVLINYRHSQYEFCFAFDSVAVGKPIQVKETNEEMATSLSDDVKFIKSEYFNNNVRFEGYFENYGGNLDTTYLKSTFIEKKVGSRGIFYSDAKQAQASWNLPVPGSSVRVRYSKLHEDAKYLTTLFFHESYPQEECVITFKIPVWLNVEFVERNFEGFSIQRMDSSFAIGTKLVPITPGTKPTTTAQTKPKPAPKSTQKPKASDSKFRYVTYTIKNTKALKEESLYPGPTHNLPHLIVLCKSYDSVEVAKITDKPSKVKTKQAPKQVKTSPSAKAKKTSDTKTVRELPQNIKGTIANTHDLYNWCHEITNLTDNKIDSVKPLAIKLTQDQSTDKEKVKAIYYWVQDNIRYVAFEDGIAAFKPDACQNVLKKKYGDCKGMANLIKCMLVSVGFDARLTWIGTHRLNIDYSIPSVSTSNHMICTIVLDGQRYFLDGTEKYIALGDNAHRIQGRPVMIEDGKNYLLDTVPNMPYSRNQHSRVADFVIAENGKVSGKVVETITGENKTGFLYRYHYSEKSDQPYTVKGHLKDYDPNFSISNITHTNFDNRDTDLVLTYDLAVQYNSIKDDGLMLVKADYVKELMNHDNDTNRMSNIAYGHKLYYTHHYSYQLPKGYSVRDLPKPLTIETDEYRFDITYKQVGNTVVYEKKVILFSGYVGVKNIKQWNDHLTQLEEAYKTYFVLAKN